MTAVALPAALTGRMTVVSLGLINPGQIVHRSPWSGTSQTLARGVGFWAGSVEVHQARTRADAAAIAAVWEQLAEPGRWVELPHHEEAPDEAFTVTAYAGGVATVMSTAAAGQVGRFLRAADGRSYRIRTDGVQAGDRSITLMPQRALTVGEVLAPTPTVRAYADDPLGLPATRHDLDFRGPWVWAWRELP